MKNDPVNNPSHYTGKFECIEVMEEALGRNAVIDFCRCNAFKYLYRHKKKNGIEDLKKAQWYLNKLIKMLEESRPISETSDEVTKSFDSMWGFVHGEDTSSTCAYA